MSNVHNRKAIAYSLGNCVNCNDYDELVGVSPDALDRQEFDLCNDCHFSPEWARIWLEVAAQRRAQAIAWLNSDN